MKVYFSFFVEFKFELFWTVRRNVTDGQLMVVNVLTIKSLLSTNQQKSMLSIKWFYLDSNKYVRVRTNTLR